MDVRAPHGARVEPAAAPRTETSRAIDAFTPQSRRLLPTALLDARVGRSTLAGSLNDQVRFRVQRIGSDPKDWLILPDTKLAADLIESRAGSGLMRQLHASMLSTGSLGATSNLRGFILPDDLESLVAARAISLLEDPASSEGRDLARLGATGDTAEAAQLMRSWSPEIRARSARSGAWNTEGWITYAPHTARAMLVAAGAYDPHGRWEPMLMQAGARTTYLAGNGPHEVQHSVSDRTPHATATWLEEGIANVFSRTPTFLARNRRSSGLTPERYASQLSHAPWFETGWSHYVRPKLTPEQARERDTRVGREYDRSQVVLRDLVRLAGADFRSTAGKALAFDLLQRQSIRYVPGVLADAIIERHGVDPTVRERLREHIKVAVDIEGGVAALAREFGISA